MVSQGEELKKLLPDDNDGECGEPFRSYEGSSPIRLSVTRDIILFKGKWIPGERSPHVNMSLIAN